MFQEFNKIELIDYLISTKRTGTRQQLSQRLEVSTRTVSRYIEMMNLNGAQIKFNRSKNTFEYAKPGRFVISFGFKEGINL